MKYEDSRDSALVLTNRVDENYLPLHEYQLVAGGNFVARPTTAKTSREVIVNQQVLKRFNIGTNDPAKARGEEITLTQPPDFSEGRKMTIVGVMNDFHYGKVQDLIVQAQETKKSVTEYLQQRLSGKMQPPKVYRS